MPVVDLRSYDRQDVDAHVCIVGAGAAGLFLASSLARRRVSAVVLEAGGRVSASEKTLDAEAAVEGDYRAASKGRAFGLGGTTALWGGRLVPYSRLDLRETREENTFDFWRHAVPIVERRSEEVCSTLGMRPMCRWSHAADCLPAPVVNGLHQRGVETLVADWIPFRKRNLSHLAERQGFTVLLNAPAVSWGFRSDGSGDVRVESVEARAGGKTLTVKARVFVVAAGAIETTRILLEMERAMSRPFRMGAALGRGLGDHLSCRVADVEESGRALCAETFAPRFRHGRMRSFHFVEKNSSAGAPRGFFHFIFEDEDPGFALARKVLLALQARTIPRVPPWEAARGATGVAALAWARLARRRLYVPGGTPAHLQLDLEQTPDPANRVTLSDARDASGRWKALVRWGMGLKDEEAIRSAAARLLAAWPQGECFPRLLPALDKAGAAKPYDTYHPVGTCRMGEDAEAVVNGESRVHGAVNLFVSSTAVIPSAGTANPTFSMICLGAELSERLARK